MTPKSLFHYFFSKSNPESSIQRNLNNSVSVIFGAFLFAVFLAVDIGLDDWVEKQFDQAMLNKANYLKTQIKVVNHKVEFNTDERFIPQYSNNDDPHYFQLWQAETTLKRSATMAPYPNDDLIKPDLQLGTDRIIEVTMPDGKLGRASLSYFIPENNKDDITPLSLTIYHSAQGLERLLLVVDALLIGSLIVAIMIMRYVTAVIIKTGLTPLEELNKDLKKLHCTDNEPLKELKKPKLLMKEIEPIRRELNNFIRSNQELMNNEKRITADIAHELKTPLAEMITLSEVYIRYPNDERISKTYKNDILAIAKRMKVIVENLLLLQSTSSPILEAKRENMSIEELLKKIQRDLMVKYPMNQGRLDIGYTGKKQFSADRFSVDTILINLLDNALFYSPKESSVKIRWIEKDGKYQLEITNFLEQAISKEQLKKMTLPLYQIDTSRTHNERFGLGLSITSNICRRNGYSLIFSQIEKPLKLRVILEIPK